MDKQKVTALTQKHRSLFRFLFRLHNRFPFVNRRKGRIRTQAGLSYLKGCRITGGAGNTPDHRGLCAAEKLRVSH